MKEIANLCPGVSLCPGALDKCVEKVVHDESEAAGGRDGPHDRLVVVAVALV